jgi:hypothetical protein
VSESSIAAQIHEPFDVHCHFAPQIALDLAIGVDDLSDAGDLIVGQIVRFGVIVNTGLGQDHL